MTKREFVEQAAMRIFAANDDISEDDAVGEAIGLWDAIEKRVPSDPPGPRGGGIQFTDASGTPVPPCRPARDS